MRYLCFCLAVGLFFCVHAGDAAAFFTASSQVETISFEDHSDKEGARATKFKLVPAEDGNMQGTVIQLGHGKAQPRTSQGTDVPAAQAFKMIVPSDWEVLANGDSAESILGKAVSWKSAGEDSTWIDALEDLGKKNDLEFLADWKHNRLYVSRSDSKDPVDITGGEDLADLRRQRWSLKPGSFKKQLKLWCEEAGYQLAWATHFDWQLSVDAVFEGTFAEALRQAVASIRASGGNLIIDCYKKNKVIVVKGD